MAKLIVAEDDKYLGNAYRVKFTKEGFEVKIATDGEEVFTLMKDFVPDVVLLDLVMPKKDGFEVLEEIKANKKYSSIPVMVTSNLGQEEDIKKAKELGAADYIVKSNMKMADLVERVKRLIK